MSDQATSSDPAEIGRRAQEEGLRFEHQVADIYRLLGYSVEERRGFDGREVDLFLNQRIGDLIIYRAIECKRTNVTADHLDSFLAKLRLVQGQYPSALGAIVSSQQFTPGVRSHAVRAGVTLTLFRDLQSTLIDGHGYCSRLVEDIASNSTYRLDHFIEPTVRNEDGMSTPALDLIRQWLGDDNRSQLTLLGDVGTGKSFLTRTPICRAVELCPPGFPGARRTSSIRAPGVKTDGS